MIEIRHLHLIQAIAETGSVTRASERLFLTQPSLSYQLKEIESRLDARLFLRVNKTMVLTQEGKQILDAGSEILAKVSALERGLKSNNGRPRQLRITTQCYTCYHWLPPLMKKFQTDVPNTEIDIVAEAITNANDFLLKGKIDLAITNNNRPVNGVRFEKLFDDELVTLVPASHPLAHKKFLLPTDFSGETLIIYKTDSGNDHFMDNVLTPKEIKVGRVIKMQLTEARVELVRAGMGLSVMSRWLAKPFLRDSKSIKLIPITKRKVLRTWYIATLDQKENDPVIRHFTNFLKDQQLGA
jgi:LysR family transcriptional regulator, regulator for metE and metH